MIVLITAKMQQQLSVLPFKSSLNFVLGLVEHEKFNNFWCFFGHLGTNQDAGFPVM